MQRLDTFWDAFVKMMALIFLIFQEIRMVMIGVTILIIADQISGVWRAFKTSKFEWRKFNRFYTKIILYLICILVFYVYENMILELPGHYFTKGVGAVIGFQELSSIYLNVSSITGTNFLKNWIKKFDK